MGFSMFTCVECGEAYTEYSQGASCCECQGGLCQTCSYEIHGLGEEDSETVEACQECRDRKTLITITRSEYEALLDFKAKYEGLG